MTEDSKQPETSNDKIAEEKEAEVANSGEEVSADKKEEPVTLEMKLTDTTTRPDTDQSKAMKDTDNTVCLPISVYYYTSAYNRTKRTKRNVKRKSHDRPVETMKGN